MFFFADTVTVNLSSINTSNYIQNEQGTDIGYYGCIQSALLSDMSKSWKGAEILVKLNKTAWIPKKLLYTNLINEDIRKQSLFYAL